MAKKSWFSLLKRFFIADKHSKSEKGKRRRWVLGRLKRKRLTSVSAPSLSRERPISEAEEEQSEHSVNAPLSTHRCTTSKDTQEFSVIDVQSTHHQWERGVEDIAATRIQSAFRAYLARKALRALKGLVRLQAIIRGRAVRRQAMTTLKCLESIVSIQSEVCATRHQMVEGPCNFHDNKELEDFKEKIDPNSQRRWDDSLLSKDEANALFLSKREAVVKRERIKEYCSIHRRSAELEQHHLNGRWRYWLEQWVDTQLSKNPETIFLSNTRIREEHRGQQLKLRSPHKQQQHHTGVFDSPTYIPRRSFHKKQHSLDQDNATITNNGGFPSSPILPTYMAATESAKARARSVSSPRLREVCLDAYSEIHSPCKQKLSPISSINSEVMSSGGIGNLSGFISQRSPCLKGLPDSGSEFLLPNWDRSKW